MKKPYSQESWTRFKTLMQKLTKRTAIVETRAQNNEDDISELKPAVEELQEFAENVNDITTGVNLFRQTRDFTLTTNKSELSSTTPSDGFLLSGNYADRYYFSKDNEGFTILTYDTNLTGNKYCYASAVLGIKPYEVYTLSFEFTSDNFSELANEALGTIGRQTASGTATSVTVTISNATGQSKDSLENNKWYKAVFHYTLGAFTDPSQLMFAFVTNASGNLSYKKLLLYRGKINNPEWSANPFDVVPSYGAPTFLGMVEQQNIIPEGADINTYTKAGTYASPTNDNSRTLINAPINDTAFKLYVDYGTGNSSAWIQQKAKTFNDAALEYFRYSSDSGRNWTNWRQTYANTTVRPLEGGGTGGATLEGARNNLKIASFLEDNPLTSIDDDTVDFWNTKPSGFYLFNTDKFVMNGQPSSYGVLFHWTRVKNVITQVYFLEGTGKFSSFWLRKVNGSDAGKVMPEFIGLPTQLYQPYASGIYPGRNLKDVFAYLTQSNSLPNVLASRVSQGNFVGINIGDYVDIACTGATRRYVVAAIDPYYNIGSPSRMGHHIVMVPNERWSLSSSRDGAYAVGTGNNYIKWTTRDNNNGLSTETAPYLASNLHQWESNTAIKQFPAEWQNVMIDYLSFIETKYSASSTLTTASGAKWANLGKLWSPSVVEIFGNSKETSPYGARFACQFPLFYNASSSYKIASLWTRDTLDGSTNNAICVNYIGGYTPIQVNAESICAYPCFMIG